MDNETSKANIKKRKIGFFDKEGTQTPCLVLISLFLLLIFKISTWVFPNKTDNYLGYLILQLIIFFVPAYLYSKLTAHRKLSLSPEKFRITLPHVEHVFLIISGCVAISSLMFLVNAIFRYNVGYPDGFYLYNTFFTGNIDPPDSNIYPFITFALLPAICEEFVFRGLIHKSYEKNGFVHASIVCAFLYALISLDLRLIPSSILFSLFMSVILYFTNSIVSCFVINLVYKSFMLFLGTNMADYLLSDGKNALLIVSVVFMLLLSLSVFFFEISKLLHQNAKNKDTTHTLLLENTKGEIQNIASSLCNICVLLCIVIYIAFNIIGIFFN